MNIYKLLTGIGLAALCLVVSVRGSEASAVKAESAVYKNGAVILHGCVYKPQGKGPFPAVIFNQPAEHPTYENLEPAPFACLAELFTSHGYVFFIPGRFHHDSTIRKPSTPSEARLAYSQLQDQYNSDVIAAVAWLKAQAYVDESKLALLGTSSGAVQSLLVTSIQPEFRGTIIFSPGVLGWRTQPALRESLKNAITTARAPVFLVQVQNDESIKPSVILGNILLKKGQPNRVKVFPPFGDKPSEALAFAANGSKIWEDDVLAFLAAVLKS